MSHDNQYRLFAVLTAGAWIVYALAPDGWWLVATIALSVGLVFSWVRARREARIHS